MKKYMIEFKEKGCCIVQYYQVFADNPKDAIDRLRNAYDVEKMYEIWEKVNDWK